MDLPLKWLGCVLKGLVGLNIHCTRCIIDVDLVSGLAAYHVKRGSKLHADYVKKYIA